MSEVMLPPEVRDRSTWYAADETDWVEEISADQIGEVEAAVRLVEESGVEIEKISAGDVSLETLGPRLQVLLDEVLKGRGFVVIKGLPIERWIRRQAAIAFLIIGAHLGDLRMQNAEGHLLGHVTDLGRSSDDPNTRIYQTRERQVGSSRVDLQACKLEYSIVSPK